MSIELLRKRLAADRASFIEPCLPSPADRPPPEGWSAYPNLRFRPHAPNKGRGRLQIQVRRCFVGYRFRTTSQVFDYALVRVRGDGWRQRQRWSVVRVLREIAEPICKVPPHNAWLWRLKGEHPNGDILSAPSDCIIGEIATWPNLPILPNMFEGRGGDGGCNQFPRAAGGRFRSYAQLG
jgi:hypothetical protein